MKTRLLVLISVLAVLAVACADNRTAPPPPDDLGDAAATAGPSATGTDGDGGVVADPARAAVGEELFGGSCVACHGPGGAGIEGLGKALAGSDFIRGMDDQALVEFIAVGRGTDDPANSTGVAMPARGGNPSLTDDQLADIVAYLRTLN